MKNVIERVKLQDILQNNSNIGMNKCRTGPDVRVPDNRWTIRTTERQVRNPERSQGRLKRRW